MGRRFLLKAAFLLMATSTAYLHAGENKKFVSTHMIAQASATASRGAEAAIRIPLTDDERANRVRE